jgi:hypothetical protein
MSNSGFNPNSPYLTGLVPEGASDEVPPLALFVDQESAGRRGAAGGFDGDPAQNDKCLLPPTVAEFLKVFESLSGWKAEFVETRESWRRRTTSEHPATVVPSGSFEIVDMSDQWPAQKTTAHRGQCDQLIQLFGALFGQLQASQAELAKSQSALEASAPGTVQDDEALVDAFVPLFTNDAFADDEFTIAPVGDENKGKLEFAEDDFEVCQRIEDGFDLDPVVWKGWSVAGTVGLNGDAYLDWQQQRQLITIGAGVIESSLGDGDASAWLKVCAETQRYLLCDGSDLKSFYVWDRRGGVLSPVQLGGWKKLHSGNALIASTTELKVDGLLPGEEHRKNVSVEDLLQAVLSQVDGGHRTLALKRD